MDKQQAYRFSPYSGQPLAHVGKGHFKDSVDGRDVYFNPAPTAAALVADNTGGILLAQRAFAPGKGMWDLPGGFVDLNETIEQALIRELKEELGAVVKTLKYFGSGVSTYPYQDIVYPIIDTAWLVELQEDINEFVVGDDVMAVKWVTYHTVNYEEMWGESVKKFVRAYFDHLQKSSSRSQDMR